MDAMYEKLADAIEKSNKTYDIPRIKMQPRTQTAVLGVATGNWNRRRQAIRKYVRLFGAT